MIIIYKRRREDVYSPYKEKDQLKFERTKENASLIDQLYHKISR